MQSRFLVCFNEFVLTRSVSELAATVHMAFADSKPVFKDRATSAGLSEEVYKCLFDRFGT